MLTKRYFLLTGWLWFSLVPSGFSQELNCKINISYDQVKVNQQATNATQLYAEMQAVMTDLINGRRWSTDAFAPEEKINMTLSLIVQRATAQGDYECQAQVQVTRPVYGSSYESVLLRFVDRSFQFNYLPDKPLNYNDNSYSDNLTSLLAFYAYTALAMDYDSFGKLGGNPYILRAYNVANLAQNSPYAGWDSRGDSRTRYWLAENLQSQQMQPFREAIYTYHRLALDTFNDDPDQARKQILDVLDAIRQVNQLKPTAVLVNAFFDAKSDELVQIFSNASPEARRQAFTLLSQLDPTKTESYRRLNR
ncbi:MAG: DUF4835 family protein [Cytophagaceae bacterium]|nr:DUF4835 family protein [Cytophagaceae bacterium]